MITRMATDKTLMFWCPGCDGAHGIPVEGPEAWCWNGSMESPTITPSILVNKDRANPTAHVCHSFVTDGKIQFLNDCTHSLAGQTVALPEWE